MSAGLSGEAPWAVPLFHSLILEAAGWPSAGGKGSVIQDGVLACLLPYQGKWKGWDPLNWSSYTPASPKCPESDFPRLGSQGGGETSPLKVQSAKELGAVLKGFFKGK